MSASVVLNRRGVLAGVGKSGARGLGKNGAFGLAMELRTWVNEKAARMGW